MYCHWHCCENEHLDLTRSATHHVLTLQCYPLASFISDIIYPTTIMKIHPLVPFALAVASATAPTFAADSSYLRANRHLQDEEVREDYILPSVSHSGIPITPDAYTDDEELDEARKGGPKVITGNAQGTGTKKAKGAKGSGKIEEIKVVALVLFEGQVAEDGGWFTSLENSVEILKARQNIIRKMKLECYFLFHLCNARKGINVRA